MSRAVEESNRRLLRARDAMDRPYAEPLDVPTLARDRARLGGALHPHVPGDVRRDAAPLPAAAAGRAGDVPAARRPTGSVTDICMDVGFTSLGTFSRTFRDIVGESPSGLPGAAGRCRRVPTCFAMAWTATEQFWRSAGGGALASVRRHVRPRLTITQIYVLDQDEALDFYVGKLGLEVNTDADLGSMRWLTLNVPGEPEQRDPALDARDGPRRGDGRRRSASW